MSDSNDAPIIPMLPNISLVPVIPVDYLEHDEDHPCCLGNPGCLCHEDPQTIAKLNSFVQEGHLTPWEATNIINGKNA